MLSNKVLNLVLALFFLIVLIIMGCSDKSNPEKKSLDQKTSARDYASADNDTLVSTDASNVIVKHQYQWIDSNDIPPIAIVVDDFGQISGSLLEGFMDLDSDITFAVLPDLPYSKQTAQMANMYGHEVVIHIPMEAMDKNQKPGINFIKAGQDEEDITDIINKFIEQIPQAVGANNHMGSSATSDYGTMLFVMKALKKKDLFFLDSKTTSSSVVISAAQASKVKYATRDIFLDVPDMSPNTLDNKLQELEKYRGRLEPVIIISHCHNNTKLVALRDFTNQLKGLGFKLIPLSDAVAKFKITSS